MFSILVDKYLHIHEFFFIFGLLGYVHINNSLFEAFITTDDLGGDWRGSIAVVADNNITKKIWFGWISGRIQTGMFFFSCFPISLSFRGRLIIIVTRGKRCSVWSSFSILLRLFLRFLEKINKKNKETEMEYLPEGYERRREFSREIQNVHILLCIKMYIICIADGGGKQQKILF